MGSFPGSPRLIKCAIVLIDPNSSAVKRTIPLQYNPETLTRTLQPQTIKEGSDRTETLRLTGPPVETLRLEAEIDATDQLEFPDQNPDTTQLGIQPQLAALETIVYPSSSQIQSNTAMAQGGMLEIVPAESPLMLFVWGKNRVVPVRLTEFSITEEAFDPALNPIRAKVTLGMRVLNTNDFASNHKGATIYMSYQQQKEQMAAKSTGATIKSLGIGGLP